MISYKTQTLSFSEDINKLLCEIDTKLAKVAKEKLDSERYGFTFKKSVNNFFILSNYKKLLLEKAFNNKCLCKYSIDDFINIIKQYLTSGKVLRFKPYSSLEETTNVEQKSKVDMYIINNNYGNNITYNHVSNKYVTEASEDYWDQTDW